MPVTLVARPVEAVPLRAKTRNANLPVAGLDRVLPSLAVEKIDRLRIIIIIITSPAVDRMEEVRRMTAAWPRILRLEAKQVREVEETLLALTNPVREETDPKSHPIDRLLPSPRPVDVDEAVMEEVPVPKTKAKIRNKM